MSWKCPSCKTIGIDGKNCPICRSPRNPNFDVDAMWIGHQKLIQILGEHNIAEPPKDTIDARYVTKSNDWWVRTRSRGWLWWGGKSWEDSIHGPS